MDRLTLFCLAFFRVRKSLPDRVVPSGSFTQLVKVSLSISPTCPQVSFQTNHQFHMASMRAGIGVSKMESESVSKFQKSRTVASV